MSGNYGFVYILGNESMPDIIKIGCSERSPHARADELSKPTGVPTPFQVLCYIEIEDFQNAERNMHKWCAEYRINPAREFFHGCLRWAVQLLYFHPGRLSFADCTAGTTRASFSELMCQATEDDEDHFEKMPNPFISKEEREARAKMVKDFEEEQAATAQAANDSPSEEAA